MKTPETIEERMAFWRAKMDDIRPTINKLQQELSDYHEAYEIAKSELAARDIPTATLADVATGLATSQYPYRSDDDYNPYRAATTRYHDLLTELFGDMSPWVGTHSATSFNRAEEEEDEADEDTYAPYPSLNIMPRHADALKTDYNTVVNRIMEFFAMFDGLPESITMAVTTNDLSASGVLYIVMRDRDDAELHKMTYGVDRLVMAGTLSEILQHLANTAWYGDPETSEDDLDW